MKRNYLVLTLVVYVGVLAFALQHNQAPAPAPKASAKGPVQTFTGEISDGQCAKAGSHKAVMQKASVNSAANCVKGCSRKYGYVLYDPASKKIYKLDNQTKPADFAAQKVKITGNLDGETIHVLKIEPAK